MEPQLPQITHPSPTPPTPTPPHSSVLPPGDQAWNKLLPEQKRPFEERASQDYQRYMHEERVYDGMQLQYANLKRLALEAGVVVPFQPQLQQGARQVQQQQQQQQQQQAARQVQQQQPGQQQQVPQPRARLVFPAMAPQAEQRMQMLGQRLAGGMGAVKGIGSTSIGPQIAPFLQQHYTQQQQLLRQSLQHQQAQKLAQPMAHSQAHKGPLGQQLAAGPGRPQAPRPQVPASVSLTGRGTAVYTGSGTVSWLAACLRPRRLGSGREELQGLCPQRTAHGPSPTRWNCALGAAKPRPSSPDSHQ